MGKIVHNVINTKFVRGIFTPLPPYLQKCFLRMLPLLIKAGADSWGVRGGGGKDNEKITTRKLFPSKVSEKQCILGTKESFIFIFDAAIAHYG